MATNKFCKYQDPETSKTFVIVDKNKQPLSCHINNKCKVGNCKKLVDNPSAYTKTVDRNMFDNTNVYCDYDNDGKVATYFEKDKYNLATFTGSDRTYYNDITPLMQSDTLDAIVLKQKCDRAATSLSPDPSVKYPDIPLALRDDTQFCKYKDTDGKTYVITDKNNQPLINKDNKCTIVNFKKVIDNQSSYPNLFDSSLLENTDIICDRSNNGIVSSTSKIDGDKYKLTRYTGEAEKRETLFFNQYEVSKHMQDEKFNMDEFKRKHQIATDLFKDELDASKKLSKTVTKDSKNMDTTSPLFVALVFLLIFTVLFIIAMIFLLITSSRQQSE